MTKGERVRAALAGRPVDRVPVSFWRHFPDIDLDPLALAEALVHFHTAMTSTSSKVMPTGVYCVEDWAVRSPSRAAQWRRTCTRHAVQRIEDWGAACPLDPQAGRSAGADLLRASVRVEGTTHRPAALFSSVHRRAKVAGRIWCRRRLPRSRTAARGVRQIASTVTRYAEHASRRAPRDLLRQPARHPRSCHGRASHLRRAYDLTWLRALRGTGAIILVHMHGDQPYLAHVPRQSASALNWHDRRTRPSLAEEGAGRAGPRRRTDERALMITQRQPRSAQALEAIAQCGGRCFLLVPLCSWISTSGATSPPPARRWRRGDSRSHLARTATSAYRSSV